MDAFAVNFNNLEPLIIELHENQTSQSFFSLVKKNYQKEMPIFRDQARYTTQYLSTLATEVNDALGWDWNEHNITKEDTVVMHKKLEDYLEKEESFRHVPGHLQELLHEAHFCLHAIQYHDEKRPHGNFLQIEWFNDDSVPLAEDFEFNHDIAVGDIILQNPYVGHPPIQCYQLDDHKNIDRTCQFHDLIKPGIKINLTDAKLTDIDSYKQWWHSKAGDYVKKQGFDNIMKYTGFPVVGQVKNKEALVTATQEPILEFSHITFLR